ncbi:hypothetical protein HF086_013666 [Spodoptera exigua]|uniref:Uncharacterized protein n=1 Tax=Spodoptera exigua TaxID=7107 RepID=A0A922MKB6_SPOEX|nr:hypothetical protein HF086_013666 [Spodoptera exigua]
MPPTQRMVLAWAVDIASCGAGVCVARVLARRCVRRGAGRVRRGRRVRHCEDGTDEAAATCGFAGAKEQTAGGARRSSAFVVCGAIAGTAAGLAAAAAAAAAGVRRAARAPPTRGGRGLGLGPSLPPITPAARALVPIKRDIPMIPALTASYTDKPAAEPGDRQRRRVGGAASSSVPALPRQQPSAAADAGVDGRVRVRARARRARPAALPAPRAH